MVRLSLNKNDDYFATMIYDVLDDAEAMIGFVIEFAIGFVGHSSDSRISFDDFPFYDDHYFAWIFLSSFVIVVECLDSRLRIELLSWKLWE